MWDPIWGDCLTHLEAQERVRELPCERLFRTSRAVGVQDGPRGLQDGPRGLQDSQKDPLDRPRNPQELQQLSQNGSKIYEKLTTSAQPLVLQPRHGGGIGRRPLDPPPPVACAGELGVLDFQDSLYPSKSFPVGLRPNPPATRKIHLSLVKSLPRRPR